MISIEIFRGYGGGVKARLSMAMLSQANFSMGRISNKQQQITQSKLGGVAKEPRQMPLNNW